MYYYFGSYRASYALLRPQKPMIIILEGSDKSGKSSVVKDLSNDQKNSIVFKLHSKPGDKSQAERQKVLTAYRELFAQAERLHKNRTVIFDRAYPSEMVYSIKRGYDAFKDPIWQSFDHELFKKYRTTGISPICIIYCTASPETLLKRMMKEKEEFLKAKEVPMILQRYELFMEQTLLPVMRIDSTRSRLSNLQYIKRMLRI